MFTKTLVAVVALAALSSVVPPVLAATIDEVAAKQLELQKVELQAKIDDATRKSAPPLSATQPMSQTGGMSSVGDDEPRVVGIYGVGKDLRADVRMNGVVTTVSKASPWAGSWKLTQIDSGGVRLVKGARVVRVSISAPPDSAQTPSAMPGSVPLPGMYSR